MKKVIFILMLLSILLFAYSGEKAGDITSLKSGDPILQKMNELKVKKFIHMFDLSKIISDLYIFKDGAKGGIGVTEVDAYQDVNIMITVTKDKGPFKIESIELMNKSVYKDKDELEEISLYFRSMKGTPISDIADSTTEATKYSKRTLLKIRLVAKKIIEQIDGK